MPFVTYYGELLTLKCDQFTENVKIHAQQCYLCTCTLFYNKN